MEKWLHIYDSYKNSLYIIFNSNINHLFAQSEVVSSIAHANSFICTQLNAI